jgi:hypothetical protein
MPADRLTRVTISPGIGVEYGQAVAEIYRDAELRILGRITAALAQGIDAPSWDTEALGRLQVVRAQALRELQAVGPQAAAQMLTDLQAAYGQGAASAFSDLGLGVAAVDAPAASERAAVAAIARELTEKVTTAVPGILRGVDDVYRQVVGRAVASAVAGGQFRKDAAQEALNELASRGIDSIKTKRGTMNLPDYVDMAVRTGTANAAIQGHVDTALANGFDLVVIHPGPRACDICDRWAREVLALRDVKGTYRSELTGRQRKVDVTHTLGQARAAGFGHPNCRCGIGSFLPGVDEPSDLVRPPWDAEGYKAQQRQRGIELGIRKAKTQEALALDAPAKARATAQVKAGQKAMRDHLAAFPQLKRQGAREQVKRPGTPDGSLAFRKPLSTPPATPKVVIPPSTTPKLDALPRLKAAQTPREATDGPVANIGYHLSASLGYGVNCSHVVNAVELRARGLDVVAQPLVQTGKTVGRFATAIAAEWRNADGSPAAFEKLPIVARRANLALMHENVKGQAHDYVKGQPVGARGFATVIWDDAKSGHIFNWENTADGPVFHEGQNPDTKPEAVADYFAKTSVKYPLEFMRTDNLTPTDDLLDNGVVESATDGRERLKRAEEAEAPKREAKAKARAAYEKGLADYNAAQALAVKARESGDMVAFFQRGKEAEALRVKLNRLASKYNRM